MTDHRPGGIGMDWRHTGRFCAAAFSMDFANGMFFVALPYLALSFGVDSLQLGALTAVRGAAYVLACIPAAMLSDRCDRKILLALSAVGVSVAFGTTAAASQYRHLCAIAVFWALTTAPFWPSLFAWVGDSHRGEHLGRATGAVNLSWSLGGMLGGVLSGWLFGLFPVVPFLMAILPVGLAAAVMLRSSCGHGRPQPAPPGGTRRVGTRRELATVWLSDIAVCSLLGLMSGVFPKLGAAIGVDARTFGMLMAGLGLGRSAMFLLGLSGNRHLHDWRLALSTQVVAGAMVATVAWTSSRWALACVFLSVGIALGANYYRGLYKCLETAGSRGIKSGLHEGALLSGMLLGSLGGGAIAKGWGLRAPYVPAGVVIAILLLAQGLLLHSAHRARLRRG